MLTSSAKHALGLVALAFLGLIGFTAGDIALGSVNSIADAQTAIYESIFEWRTGDLFGVILFSGLFAGACFLFAAVLMARDGERPAEATAETPALAPSYWPLLVAVGLGVAMFGLVMDTLTFVFGGILVAIGAFEWIVNAWTDRHSAEPARNSALRNRLMLPLEIPVFGVVLMGIPVIMLSRVLLATTKTGAALVATVLAVVLLAAFFVLYAKPDLPKGLITGGAVFGVVAIVVAGVVATAIGQREFEIHVGDHHGDEEQSDDHSDEEGLGLLGPIVLGTSS